MLVIPTREGFGTIHDLLATDMLWTSKSKILITVRSQNCRVWVSQVSCIS